MKATELLRRTHDQLAELFSQLGAAWDAGEKRAVFNRLRDALVRHGQIVEAVLYPAAARLSCKRASELVGQGLDEHLRMRALLIAVDALPIDDPDFDEEIGLLCERVAKRARSDEEELLPLLGEHLGDRRLETLGRELAAPRATSKT